MQKLSLKPNDLFSLKVKSALLTGAAGFFGGYFARALLSAGVSSLYITDRKEEVIKDLADQLKEEFPDALICPAWVDQYDHRDVEIFTRGVSLIDILVNNAFDFSQATGFSNNPNGRIEKIDYEQFEKSMDSGIYWPLQLIQIFGNRAKEKKRPLSVVNIGSMYSFVAPNPNLYEGMEYVNAPGYSMAKAALIAQTRYVASFMGPIVRANAICPGAIPNREKQSNNSKQNEDPTFMQRLIDRTLLKRVGHPNDLVGALIYLASDASSYMTGQSIIIDGGWTIT